MGTQPGYLLSSPAADDAPPVFYLLSGSETLSASEKCIKLLPDHAECHLRLGVAHASRGSIDTGARHYRTYLALAPPSEQTAKVRELLENYEKKKAQARH